MGLFNSLKISINISYSQIFLFFVFKVVSLEVPEGKDIYATYGESVLSATKRADLGVLAPCTHEEAENRMYIPACSVPWMQPHADIDESGLEGTIQMWLCSLFQLLALFK